MSKKSVSLLKKLRNVLEEIEEECSSDAELEGIMEELAISEAGISHLVEEIDAKLEEEIE